jgi:hypothetical protein
LGGGVGVALVEEVGVPISGVERLGHNQNPKFETRNPKRTAG